MSTHPIDPLLAAMTLEEQVGLLSGAGFWTTAAVPRLGVPAVKEGGVMAVMTAYNRADGVYDANHRRLRPELGMGERDPESQTALPCSRCRAGNPVAGSRAAVRAAVTEGAGTMWHFSSRRDEYLGHR